MKNQSLFDERFLRQPRDFLIDPGRDARQEFEDRHFRPQPAPHRAEFQPDVTGADDQVGGHLVKGERSVELTIDEPSNGRLGKAVGSLPVASRTAFASQATSPSLPLLTSTLPAYLAGPCRE